jgi:predicted regulator of Ras-like GTPase activity (Roadblock/LC7/MglB family)
MAKKKKSAHEAATTLLIEGVPITPYEEDPTFAMLRTRLAEINKTLGVTGYILRNANSATIDLKNQEKLTDYAILSSQAIGTSDELSELFDIGKVNHVLIEGKNQKILCLTMEGNNVAIFMENDTDHKAIIKQLLR